MLKLFPDKQLIPSLTTVTITSFETTDNIYLFHNTLLLHLEGPVSVFLTSLLYSFC